MEAYVTPCHLSEKFKSGRPDYVAVALDSCCVHIGLRGLEMLRMVLSTVPEIDHASAHDLGEILHAGSGHRLGDGLAVIVLVPLIGICSDHPDRHWSQASNLLF
jgi:hypothetical protein